MVILPLILVFGLGLLVAIRIARTVQRGVDAANKKAAENKKKQKSKYHWVWSCIHWVPLAVIPAAKYVYREWKTSPPNSLEKFLWTMLFALTVAVVIWILLRFVDKLVNRETKPAVKPENALVR